MIEWIYESDSFETFCWAEMEWRGIMISRTDDLRWKWRLEVPMKGRKPTGECATLEQAKKNALAAYAYVNEAAVRNAVAKERAAVVAWLRREIQKCGCDDDTAACIERGEHRREEGA